VGVLGEIQRSRDKIEVQNLISCEGIRSKKGVNFEEFFSYVVKMSSIRVVLNLAASLDLKIEQLDVKIVFLHGDLEEELYMEQPRALRWARALDMQVEDEPLWFEASAPKVI
jgi:Reverse transcriptase (RNA-dependent DNA polymerase)